MKKFIPLLFIFSIANGFAQSPNFRWAKKGTGSDNDQGYAVCSDGAGNTYITGSFQSASITFGSFTLNNDTTDQTDDMFVVKYDTGGTVVWARSAGSNSYDQGHAISCDGYGNVYVAGVFYGPVFTAGSFTLNNYGNSSNDIFIVKYDSSGNEVWARNLKGTYSDDVNGITADYQGCYITGSFQSQSLVVGADSLVNGNPLISTDFYIAHFTNSGNPVWARSAGGSSFDAGYGICSSNYLTSVCVTGYFSSASITFGNTTLNNTNSNQELFVVKYDSMGNALWAKKAGGPGDEAGYGVCSDWSGDVYVSGSFTSPTLTFPNTTASGPGGLLLKYSISGTLRWGMPSDVNVVSSIAADFFSGAVYTTGQFSGSWVSFGSDTLYNANNNGSSDIFIAKYDSAGGWGWATKAGGTSYDIGTGIALTPAGEVLITGSFQGASASFGSLTLSNTSPSSADAFAAKLDNCIEPVANICMVTVDSLSQNNIIIWDKTSFQNVDSFIVYREITTNTYRRIGAVPYAALSELTDTVRMQYFPNTGDPNAGTYRYKLQTRNTCGEYGALSPFHNTIFMTNNNGTFTWPQLYTIENGPNPVNAYVLMRDDYNTGSWHAVNSVSGTQQSVTDPAYSSWSSTANWRIQTLWNISCTPTLRYSNNAQTFYSSSHSNLLHTLTSVNGNDTGHLFSISPNPSNGKFTVSLSDATLEVERMEVYDLFGKCVFKGRPEGTINGILDISALPEGVYFLKIYSLKGQTVKKLVIAK
ncbi:MAG TPA: T9SS type A sorting domain-containing protein [Bacteroidia bacterium]|jgi:hypothetical protein